MSIVRANNGDLVADVLPRFQRDALRERLQSVGVGHAVEHAVSAPAALFIHGAR